MPTDYNPEVHGELDTAPQMEPVDMGMGMPYDEGIHGKVEAPATEPEVFYGDNAVAQVMEREGELSPMQRAIVMEEGFVDGDYDDTKGISTSGVGQTGEFKGMSFKEAYDIQEQRAKRYIPGFDGLPEELQTELMVAQYRGDLGGSPKFRRLINEGNFTEAAEEYLDNKEYLDRDTPLGIKKRFERMYDYLVSLAPKGGSPEETSEEVKQPELKALQDGFYEDDSGETVEVRGGIPYTSTGDVLKGFGEVGLTGITAAAGEIGGGLAGLFTFAMTGDLSKGADTVANVQKALSYEPKTAEGKAILEALGTAMEPVMKELESYKTQTQEGLAEAGYGEGVQALAGAQQDALVATAGMAPAGKIAGATKLGQMEFEVGDIGASGPGKSQAGMMAGVKAKGADMDAYAKAEDLLAKGKDPEAVRKQTGWWKHHDGTMRFEFSDADSEMVLPARSKLKAQADRDALRGFSNYNNTKYPYTLGELFKHDKLFDNYPEAKGYRIGFYDDVSDSVNGFAGGSGKHLALNLKGRDIKDPEILKELRSTTLHEIAHLIQTREGFTRGGSVRTNLDTSLMTKKGMDYDEYTRTNQDLTKQAFENAFPGEFARAGSQSTYFPTLIKDLVQNGIDKGIDKFVELHTSKGIMMDLEKTRETLTKGNASVGLIRMINMANNLSPAKKKAFIKDLERAERDFIDHELLAQEKYYNTLGELDARNTEARMDFSEETLKELPLETTVDSTYKRARGKNGELLF